MNIEDRFDRNFDGWKCFFIWLTIFSASLLTLIIISNIRASYHYERDISSSWELANKASTIETKYIYISKFVDIIKENKEKFATHNAIWLETPNNSFDNNLAMLETLKDRLNTIKGMNPNSFEYQTAIQQITAQEQGEAHNMLNVFEGCYFLNNYMLLWGWIGGIIVVILALGLIIGCFGWIIRAIEY